MATLVEHISNGADIEEMNDACHEMSRRGAHAFIRKLTMNGHGLTS